MAFTIFWETSHKPPESQWGVFPWLNKLKWEDHSSSMRGTILWAGVLYSLRGEGKLSPSIHCSQFLNQFLHAPAAVTSLQQCPIPLHWKPKEAPVPKLFFSRVLYYSNKNIMSCHKTDFQKRLCCLGFDRILGLLSWLIPNMPCYSGMVKSRCWKLARENAL